MTANPVPCRWFRGGLRIFVLSGLFLALFGLTTLLTCATAVGLGKQEFLSGPNLVLGLLCSLVFWLFMAVFHLRRETVSMTALESDPFLDQAQSVLQELGYDVRAQGAHGLIARPMFQSFLLGGKLEVHLENGQAAIRGPRVMTELVRRRLRVQGHLDRVQREVHNGRVSTGDLLYKRVQLQVRLNVEHWHEFAHQVLAPLQDQGQLLAEVNLLVQSDEGVAERVVDQAAHWLEKQGLTPEVHKDIIQREVPSAVLT